MEGLRHGHATAAPRALERATAHEAVPRPARRLERRGCAKPLDRRPRPHRHVAVTTSSMELTGSSDVSVARLAASRARWKAFTSSGRMYRIQALPKRCRQEAR